MNVKGYAVKSNSARRTDKKGEGMDAEDAEFFGGMIDSEDYNNMMEAEERENLQHATTAMLAPATSAVAQTGVPASA